MAKAERGETGAQGIQGVPGHNGTFPCPAHSGLAEEVHNLSLAFNRKIDADREDAARIWAKLDEALQRWPQGATIAVSVMSGVSGLIIGAMGMYIKLAHS